MTTTFAASAPVGTERRRANVRLAEEFDAAQVRDELRAIAARLDAIEGRLDAIERRQEPAARPRAVADLSTLIG